MGGTGSLWQDVIAIGVVIAAAIYLGRRWWPAVVGLWRPAPPKKPDCGTPQNASDQAAGCSTGCGHCGSSGAAPKRDHRTAVVRPPTRH
ncbi:MAG: hypothetical protein KGL90_06320 [Burkholderiales bacterium]|nr:hypothetical protein [Burkholderiales bacterium]